MLIENFPSREGILKNLPIARVATFMSWVFASAITELGMTNNARILTVEENILEILIL